MSLSDYGDEFVEGAVAGAFGGFGKTLTVFGGVLGGAAGGLTEALISDETGAWQEKVAVGALFGAVGGVVDAGTIKNSRKLTEGLTAVTFRELVGPGAIINEDRWHHAKEAFRDPEQKPPAAPVRGWNAQMSCGG